MGGFFLLVAGCRSESRDNSSVIARIGHSVITQNDFKARLEEMPPAYQQYVATAEGQRKFLDLLIREKLTLEYARQAGLQKNDRFRDALDAYKRKQEQDLKDYREGLLIKMGLAQLETTDLAVTDADLHRYYDEHVQDFQHPVEYQASHILVNTPEQAEQVLAQLKAGVPFEKLAHAVSMDPATAAVGGKLKPFTKGSLLPEFEDAVVGLKNGQISGVVKTQFGYHIIKKTSQRPLPPVSFEEAKGDIQNRLQRDRFDQWVTKQQAAWNVTIDEKALNAVTTAPGVPPAGAEGMRSGTAAREGESNQ